MIVDESNYSARNYRTPDGAPSDIVIFTIISTGKGSAKKSLPSRELHVMLIQRKVWPFQGQWALPGGFCKDSESMYECAQRELHEETGVEGFLLQYLNVYSTPGRDPRGWIISHAFLALVNEKMLKGRRAAVDAMDVHLFPVREALSMELAFDHRQILEDALVEIRKQMLTTTIAKEFLPKEFTISELYQVIQAIVPEFDEKNFVRKITSTQSRKGIIEEVRDHKGDLKKSNEYSQRAAQLYRFSETEPRLSLYQ